VRGDRSLTGASASSRSVFEHPSATRRGKESAREKTGNVDGHGDGMRRGNAGIARAEVAFGGSCGVRDRQTRLRRKWRKASSGRWIGAASQKDDLALVVLGIRQRRGVGGTQ